MKVSGVLSEKEQKRIERGVRLSDGVVRAKLHQIKKLKDASWYRISIGVGKNRIIRRLMDHLRHPVLKLKRVQHGPFKLQGLKPGELMVLDSTEFQASRQRIFSTEKPAA